MGRQRRSPAGEQSVQSVEPDSRTVTRSRSTAAAGSVTSRQSEMAPTVTQEEPSTASKRPRISSAPRRRRRGITGADGGARVVTPASTVGVEEVEVVPPRSVAPAASDPMVAATAFVPNSPVRMPYLVEYDSKGQPLPEPSVSQDPELSRAYLNAYQQYCERIGQLLKLPTLDNDTAIDSIPIQDSAADTILKDSKFVLGLSAYIDDVLLRQSSGILMEWNEDKGTILTTVHLFCSRSPNVDVWLGGQEYARDAEVRVQLLHIDDIEVRGQLIYLDEQYVFTLISVPMDPAETLPRFCNELIFSEDIFLLGRDRWDLQIENCKVMNKGAGSYQHHHYMYFDAVVAGLYPVSILG